MFTVEVQYDDDEWESEGIFRTIGGATNYGRKELINIDWRIVNSRTGKILQTFDASESRFYVDLDPVRQAHRDKLFGMIDQMLQKSTEESRREMEQENWLRNMDHYSADEIFGSNNLDDCLRIEETKLDYDWMKEGF